MFPLDIFATLRGKSLSVSVMNKTDKTVRVKSQTEGVVFNFTLDAFRGCTLGQSPAPYVEMLVISATSDGEELTEKIPVTMRESVIIWS